MKHIISLIVCLLVSCTSFDVERRVRTTGGAGKGEAGYNRTAVIPVDTEPVVIEKPVYVPQSQAPAAPVRGKTAVEQAAKTGTAEPQDYAGAAMLYDYHRDFVYEVYCRPVRVTDLALKPGEKITEPPFISDSERWMLGGGVSYEGALAVQHIYVKPTQANIEASLIINTTERVYHVILKSFSAVHMPMVRWRYPEESFPRHFLFDRNKGGAEEGDASMYADPRFLSFNYRMTYGLFKRPRWLPSLVYDDGKKTYIAFPDTVLQTELPAVFEDRADVVNYRIARNVMIIDKLIEKITVKIGTLEVVVEKKRGK